MLKPPASKPQIVRRPIVVHNDLDGILSYLFLREKGYELVGIYDLETLFLKKRVKPKDILAVDLDITHPLIPSIGHHYTMFEGDLHINMNHLFGVTKFTSKCPLPTFLFLHWLTDTPLPVSPWKRAFLVYADGLTQSHQNYKRNVTAWLKALGYEDLLEELESGIFEPHIKSILEMLASHGFEKTPQKPLPQCTFPVASADKMVPLMEEIAYHLGYTPRVTLPLLEPYLTVERYRIDYDEQTHRVLEEKFQNWELFSHGLVYQDKINVSLLTPLSKSRDEALVAKLGNPRNAVLLP